MSSKKIPIKLPWKVGSRSYNMAVYLMDHPFPRDVTQKKEQLFALAAEHGASIRTLEDVVGRLRTMGLLPEPIENPVNSAVTYSKHDTEHGENTLNTEANPDILQKTRDHTEGNMEEAPPQKDALPVSTVLQTRGSTDSEQETRDTGSIQSMVTLSPEIIQEIKRTVKAVKDEMEGKTAIMEKPRDEEDDEESRVVPMQINEGSVVARTVYLTPKSLMYYDYSKEKGYPGNLSEFVNDVLNNFFKRQNIRLGIIEESEYD